MKPAKIARIKPPSYPVISKVPVMTGGSIGKVSSLEKFMPIGIIGTIANPITITLMLIITPSVYAANVKIALVIRIKQPKQLSCIISLNFLCL